MSFFLTTQFKPKYEVTFHNGDRNIGRLDFNDDTMVLREMLKRVLKYFLITLRNDLLTA